MGYGNFTRIKVPDCYKYVLCGSKTFQYPDSISGIRDSGGDNISEKNKYYSELTGLFWSWKNDNSSIKGLVCYRRFLLDLFPFPHLIREKSIKKTLQHYDIILSKPKYLGGLTVEEQLLKGVSKKNCEILREIISTKFPDYSLSYERVMKEKSLSAFNIMIAKRELFDSYCSWLFSIFDEMEKIVDANELVGYKTRLYAFLSERLLVAWVYKNKLRVKYKTRYNTQWFKFLILKIFRKTEKQ